MKIRDITNESGNKRTKTPIVGNEKAKISRTSQDATTQYNSANVGALDAPNIKKARKTVRDLYGVELVDDFLDVLELPNGEEHTDKEMSMFSKDNRK